MVQLDRMINSGLIISESKDNYIAIKIVIKDAVSNFDMNTANLAGLHCFDICTWQKTFTVTAYRQLKVHQVWLTIRLTTYGSRLMVKLLK